MVENPQLNLVFPGKIKFGTVCETLAEFVREKPFLGLSEGLWMDASGARRVLD